MTNFESLAASELRVPLIGYFRVVHAGIIVERFLFRESQRDPIYPCEDFVQHNPEVLHETLYGL